MGAILVADFGGDGDAEESEGLGGGHVHEDGAAAEALDEEEGAGGGGHVGDAVCGCEEAGGEFGEADRFGEDEGEVVAEDIDAGELLPIPHLINMGLVREGGGWRGAYAICRPIPSSMRLVAVPPLKISFQDTCTACSFRTLSRISLSSTCTSSTLKISSTASASSYRPLPHNHRGLSGRSGTSARMSTTYNS